MTDGHIDTPRELDAAAKSLADALRTQHSPQLQLYALVAFFDETAHLPLSWRRAFLLPHFRTLLRLLLHPYTQGHHPRLWTSAWEYYRTMRGSATATVEEEMARGELLCKAVMAHAYVADLRSLHVFLRQAGVAVRDVDERQWRRIHGAGTSSLAMFEAYCEEQEEVLDVLHPLLLARQRWLSWVSRSDAVSVVLLEENDHARVAGAVLRMEIASRRRGGGVHINNVLGADADMTRGQLLGASRLASAFAHERLGYRFESREVYFQIIDLHAAFSGGSLGLAATVGLACHLSGQVNARTRWSLPADTACVASLDEDGALESVPWDTIRRKIELAFFSPLRRIVIPIDHGEQATRHVQELQQEFPQRSFEVYAADTFAACFRTGHVVETVTRNPYDRLHSFSRRHARSAAMLFALLVLLAAGTLFYETFFMFPDLEETQGIVVGNSAIVYNPHDSVVWAFRDGRQILPAMLAFGDLEVGDGFSRSLSVYNMTPGRKPLHVSVEGRDAGQWYINSGGPDILLESVVPANISIRYAPTAASAAHEAALVLRDEPGGTEHFRVALSGAAGRAMAAGYALRLGRGPEYMSWGKNGLAFTNGEMTIEGWVRSLTWDGCLLHNGSSSAAQLEQGNLTISFSDGFPWIRLGSKRFNVPLDRPMKPNQWRHIALAYSISRPAVMLYLDGERVFESRESFEMPDRMAPYVSLGAYADSSGASSFLECEVDNFRVWWNMLDETGIRRVMDESVSGASPMLKANFDMEASCERTGFNGSGESPDAELRFRPSFVRSSAPVKPGSFLPRLTVGPHALPALSLTPGSYLHFARQLLPRTSDATFSFWWHTGRLRTSAFVVKNLDHFISISSDTVVSSFSGCRSDVLGSVTPGWHHFAVRVLKDGRKEIFIDGTQRAAIDACRTPGVDFHDWHNRYEGISFGVFDDKYNMFSARMHAAMRESLSRTRLIADIAVWRRMLDNVEIARIASGGGKPPDHLVAHWQFDHAPTAEMNFLDSIEGHLLHIRIVPAYR